MLQDGRERDDSPQCCGNDNAATPSCDRAATHLALASSRADEMMDAQANTWHAVVATAISNENPPKISCATAICSNVTPMAMPP